MKILLFNLGGLGLMLFGILLLIGDVPPLHFSGKTVMMVLSLSLVCFILGGVIALIERLN
mgnify:CR=1 FL=1